MGTAATSVLVVEDNEPLRCTISELLQLDGYTTVVACHGEEALGLVRRSLPDLIVTDLAMPVLDGYGLLRALRANEATKAVPVVVLSAKLERANIDEALALGAADFVSKPFEPEKLFATVAKVLKAHRGA